MATYSDHAQRDLDQRSGAAIDRRISRRELAEHYAWNGPQAQWLIDADDNERVVFCDACDGNGRIDDGYGYCSDGPECPYCNGTGYEVITVEPIEIEDLPPC